MRLPKRFLKAGLQTVAPTLVPLVESVAQFGKQVAEPNVPMMDKAGSVLETYNKGRALRDQSPAAKELDVAERLQASASNLGFDSLGDAERILPRGRGRYRYTRTSP